MRLADSLAGKRILLTGVTGFVGEALLHKLLRDVPGCTVVAMVRPKQGQTAEDRVAKLLGKGIFADLPEGSGARVETLSGDLYDVPALPTDLDVVVHCAGDVSFDPPIQSAFQTNVVGVQGLVERVVESARQPDGSHRPLHYVHVSTAYVGGRRRGPVMEVSVEHTVDWRAEHEAAQRVAARIEDTSRTPAVLSRLVAKAEKDHDRAGPLAVAADAEERRRTWVTDQQKAAGGERARSLGWTDVYTFTKALGERVVEEVAAPVLPTTVYRPSIIESALTTPHPGWIEGFKMADPIILAYGRGELPELPAAPDSVIDIVPIDLVVNSIIAVAATPPPVGEPAYVHLSSGSRNPLTFRQLYDHVREYFAQHPFDMDSRGAVRLATWRFPGARIVERALTTGEKAYGVAEGALSLAPRSDRVRSIARNLDTQKRRLDFLRRYMDLYRAYTQVELYFVDDRMLAMHQAMDPEDQETFGFDTAVIDWEHYLIEVHCPAVTQGVRDYDVIRRRRGRSGGPAPRVVAPRDPSEPVDPDAAPVLAVFDMDGTLLSSNIIETYLWVRLPELSAAGKVRELAATAARLPLYLRAERRDRGALIRSAYRRYEGADLRALEEMVDETLTPHVLERVSGAAIRRVREHRAAGHRTVLITGAVTPITRPLAPLFDEIVAAELDTDSRGRCTGFLTRPPLVGEARAAWLKRYASVEGADLSQAYGYADSHSDLPMLQAVGRPTAVSPDVTLYREARKLRWPIEDWGTAGRSPRLQLPSIDTSQARLPG
ncbi:HAD-IB family hydrolase [Aquipuribacter hungaricus]|uniref:HAD-IB family hydrolase n=1 Tax=Aquipuribacter hungaricus TaxID=545624 RepID=A0ABV7WJV0_9MICO